MRLCWSARGPEVKLVCFASSRPQDQSAQDCHDNDIKRASDRVAFSSCSHRLIISASVMLDNSVVRSNVDDLLTLHVLLTTSLSHNFIISTKLVLHLTPNVVFLEGLTKSSSVSAVPNILWRIWSSLIDFSQACGLFLMPSTFVPMTSHHQTPQARGSSACTELWDRVYPVCLVLRGERHVTILYVPCSAWRHELPSTHYIWTALHSIVGLDKSLDERIATHPHVDLYPSSPHTLSAVTPLFKTAPRYVAPIVSNGMLACCAHRIRCAIMID